jgi:type II secretory pathway component GspD/PulD (secretin)
MLTVTQTSTVENIQFLNVGTLLRIRPFVTPDGMIRMEVHPERSTGDVVDGIPRTRTNEITTNVMVPNGCTVVLAGLIEEEDVVSLDGVPGLSRLPYLGPFFRREKVTTRRKELVVTLTPRIVNPSTILTGVSYDPHGVADLKSQGSEFHASQQAVTLPKVPSTIQFRNQPKNIAAADSESSQR